MKEIWKGIPGYEKYEASTLGRVRSLKRMPEKILKTRLNKEGYKLIHLYDNGTFKVFGVSQLILLTFVGSRSRKMEASHLNNDPLDNRLKNLKWETHQKNIRRINGFKMKKSNLTKEEKINIKNLLKQLGEEL